MIESVARLKRKQANGEDGFTLIELLVVVVIIGILMAIAVPLYLNYRKGANDKAAQSDVRGAISALEQCNVNNDAYPASITGTTATCKVIKSENVTLTYYSPSGNANYRLYGTSSGGSGKFYCYSSESGGGVKDSTSAPTASQLAC